MMTLFIFQSKPERYDIRKNLQQGRKDTWYATRYRKDMIAGVPVLFWLAGESHSRGIYGWGSIISTPYLKPEWDSFGVDVEYKVRFREHIPSNLLSADPVLSQMLIFRMASGTNFSLEPEEVESITRLIVSRGEQAPVVEA